MREDKPLLAWSPPFAARSDLPPLRASFVLVSDVDASIARMLARALTPAGMSTARRRSQDDARRPAGVFLAERCFAGAFLTGATREGLATRRGRVAMKERAWVSQRESWASVR